MRNICLTLVAAGTLFLLSACSDPYEREIPASGFVAAGEAEDIAGRLNDSDKDLFRRWAKRAPTNERFPGEAIPRSVRSALTNQTRFEALQAEKSAKDAEKIAEEERVAKEKQKQVDEQRDAYQKMKETDSFIKEYFIASSVPTLFEQIQLISQICRNFVLDGSRKQLIQRDSLEHRQAQDL